MIKMSNQRVSRPSLYQVQVQEYSYFGAQSSAWWVDMSTAHPSADLCQPQRHSAAEELSSIYIIHHLLNHFINAGFSLLMSQAAGLLV